MNRRRRLDFQGSREQAAGENCCTAGEDFARVNEPARVQENDAAKFDNQALGFVANYA